MIIPETYFFLSDCPSSKDNRFTEGKAGFIKAVIRKQVFTYNKSNAKNKRTSTSPSIQNHPSFSLSFYYPQSPLTIIDDFLCAILQQYEINYDTLC